MASLFESKVYTAGEGESPSQRIEWEVVTPVSPIQDSVTTGGSFVFRIMGRECKLLDLSRTQVFVRLRVYAESVDKKADALGVTSGGGGRTMRLPPVDTPNIALVNLPLHSVFGRAELRFGNDLVSRADRMYPYKAYLETLLFETESVKNNRLKMEGFYSDSVPSKNTYAKSYLPDGCMFGSNSGFDTRSRMVAKSRLVDLLGELHFDLCQQPKPIINNLDVYVTLHPSEAAFALIGDGEQFIRPRIHFEYLHLNVCRLELSKPAISRLEHQLATHPACYQYHRTEFATIRINQGAGGFDKTSLFMDRNLPHHIYVCFVREDAFLGKFKHNPYFFHHFNCSNLAVYVENQMVNGRYLNLNPENRSRSLYEAYNTLFTSLGVDGNDIGIGFDQYLLGNTIVCYQILNSFAPMSANAAAATREEGGIRIEAKFDGRLEENVICIVMAKYSAELSINRNRSVNFHT